ncbi:mycofactocin system transcriptional regulator [Nocardioides sp. NPDC057767]|uniref:Mycofactocin system transcriptional regulator n=1 Tax=Nocardioides panzhihuensis TaxID=860243 RepID=A0A7Z0DMU7_9ACTN|nr:mycofactocin system transcriptional regulator [Nocardioides panzhihuensis]NYI78392.1 mycofactocin system transcriptional regulator [Nocardioides panzhihuensis]
MPTSPAPATRRSSLRGRPAATTHAEIEQAAFQLFMTKGFEATTLDDIGEAIGVGRRTITRYYPSKNDIPWGQFDRTLDAFREILRSMPTELPLHIAVHRGVLAFNDFPTDASPSHRDRMRLILTTPALQAHSVLRYASWREVIADYVAERTGLRSDDLLPQTVGQVSLALALTSYQAWLDDEDASLPDLLDATMGHLRTYVSS